MKEYIPFDIHSSYSIGKAICTIPKLVQRACNLGLISKPLGNGAMD